MGQPGRVAACAAVEVSAGNIQLIFPIQTEGPAQAQMRPPVIAAGIIANSCSLIACKIPGAVIRLGSAGSEAALIIEVAFWRALRKR